MTQVWLLAVLFLLAILCTLLRRRAVRWLFGLLAWTFWILFLLLSGFVVGYESGEQAIHLPFHLFSR